MTPPLVSKDWLSARELASLRLPELPMSGFRMRELAKADGWAKRKRAGRGGGNEYHIDALPERARACLVVLQAQREAYCVALAGADEQPGQSELTELVQAASPATRRRIAIMAILESPESAADFIAATLHGLNRLQAFELLSTAERAGFDRAEFDA